MLSDVHYVNPEDVPAEGTAARTHFNHAESAEMRLMSEIDPILAKALDGAVATSPDAMLVSGDLTSNGEHVNAQKFASRLSQAKGKLNGAGIYVVNGNHDMSVRSPASLTTLRTLATASGMIAYNNFAVEGDIVADGNAMRKGILNRNKNERIFVVTPEVKRAIGMVAGGAARALRPTSQRCMLATSWRMGTW